MHHSHVCTQKKFHTNISARRSICCYWVKLCYTKMIIHYFNQKYILWQIYVYIQNPKPNKTGKIWYMDNLLFSRSSLNDGSISISELPSSLSFPSHLWQANTYCSPLDGMSIRTSSRNQLANGLELSWPILIFFIWKVR